MKNSINIIQSEEEFLGYMEEASTQPLIVVDTEYEKEDKYGKANIIGVSWGYPMGSLFKSFYVPFRHRLYGEVDPGNLEVELLQEFNRFPLAGTQVYHNWQADHGVFFKEGIDFSNRFIHDTMIASHLCDENELSYKLDYLCQKKFKVRKKNLSDLEKDVGWEHIHPLIMGRYACTDVYLTYMLYRDNVAQLQRQGLEDLYSIYESFIKVLYRVTSRGLHVDEKLALTLQDEGRTKLSELATKYEFNLGSAQKVADYLHNVLGVKVRYRTKKGAPSTSSLHLRRYRDSVEESRGFIQDVLDYRTTSKAVSTWYQGFLDKRGIDGLLHPGLTIAGAETRSGGVEGGTRTGRLSCREPNLQQVPRKGKVRNLFLDPPGYKLVEFDYSQAELRLIGYYMERQGDPTVANSYRNQIDIHALTAESMGLTSHMPFKDARQVGKTCNFSLCYRAGPEQLRTILYRDADFDVTSQQAATWHRAWHNTYPVVHELNELAQSTAERLHYVKMWNGRKRHLVGNDCYKAFNSIIQGGVGQLMVAAMSAIDEAFPELQMVNQVHDSIWFYLPEDEVEAWVDKIVPVMQSIPTEQFGLPFVADWKLWNG